MESKIARFFSYLFHPLSMPLLSLFLVFQLDTYMSYVVSPRAQYALYFWTFLNTFLAPGAIALVMLKRNIISSLHMLDRKERVVPFFFTACFYTSTYFMFKELPLPQPIHSMVFGACISVFLAAIITIKWKISAHLMGIGGVIGSYFGVTSVLEYNGMGTLIALVLAAGIIGWSRMRLNAHNPLQVYAGVILGFVAVYLPILMEWG